MCFITSFLPNVTLYSWLLYRLVSEEELSSVAHLTLNIDTEYLRVCKCNISVIIVQKLYSVMNILGFILTLNL